eukprot:1140393-Pelagomonas_calceolata.AAC.1
MVDTVYVVTKRTSIRGGRLVGSSDLRRGPEGDADLLVRKLTGWVVGFYVGSGDWGSGVHGIVGEVVDWDSVGAVQAIMRDTVRAQASAITLPIMPEWALTAGTAGNECADAIAKHKAIQ